MVNDTDREKLVALMHGELNSVDAGRLTERLRVEEDLRREYEALLAIDDQLEDLFVKPASEGFSRDEMDTILNKAQGAPKANPHRRFFYTAGGAAMAASLALVLWTKQNVPKPARFSTPVAEVTEVAGPAVPSASPEKKMEISEGRAAPRADVSAGAATQPAAPQAESVAGDIEAPVPAAKVVLEDSVSKKDFQFAAPQPQPAAPAAAARDEVQDSDNVSERKATENLARARSAPESQLRAKAKAGALEPMAATEMLAKPKSAASPSGPSPDVARNSSAPQPQPQPAAPAAPTSTVAPLEWFSCVASAECVLVEEMCEWRAMNKKFIKAFEELKRSSPPKKCEAPRAKKSSLKVQCKKRKCAY